MIQVQFLPAAESELLHEISYYSKARTGLGLRFHAAIQAVISRNAKLLTDYLEKFDQANRAEINKLSDALDAGRVKQFDTESIIARGTQLLARSN